MGILLMIAQPFLVSVDILILFLSSSNPSGVNLLLSIGTGSLSDGQSSWGRSSDRRDVVLPREAESLGSFSGLRP